MSSLPYWTSKKSVILAGITAIAIMPIVTVPVEAAEFSDVRGHWARPFIEALAAEEIISGFPDGTFRPDAPVTRAQFAAIVRQAFNQNKVRDARGFTDVPVYYWASAAINEAYETKFMSGYPNSQFRPAEEIPKVQVLVSLTSGLQLSPKIQTVDTFKAFKDAAEIPEYAVNGVASATENGFVVNYPNVNYLNPNEVASRGDVAAFIYQALVNKGEFQPMSDRSEAAEYIVRGTQANQALDNTSSQTNSSNQTSSTTNTQNPLFKLEKGTNIQVNYLASDKVVVTPNETINLTLDVANDIKNLEGKVLIPKGSKIEGQLVPRYSGSNFLGTQFVAQKLSIANNSYTSINATSALVTSEKPTNVNPGTVQDAATTAAARAVLGTILGQQVDLGNILTSVVTGRTNPEPSVQTTQTTLVIIDPETDLSLTFGSDFYVGTIAGS